MLLSSLAQGSRKGFEGWLRSVIVVKVEVHDLNVSYLDHNKHS